MAKVDAFLEALVNYDKENIHPEVIKAIQPYLKDSEFEPDFIRSKSAAAAGLCAWVINIIRFYEVFCDVEPKRKGCINIQKFSIFCLFAHFILILHQLWLKQTQISHQLKINWLLSNEKLG